ncbi:anthranilate phosphoribosyltransferase [Caldalkalibacillus salinus]|uniref:anthranilate phosphoribosyltransferase n=1 Tax=Caldalkalibacillus salinus TaxID=2803787 RepID=UPI00192052E6|nr:anthranilate phosphoribosyltransferase [Caldalkalibacillus salinus]
MEQWLKIVARGKKGSKDLTYAQAESVAERIISGEATDAQIGAFLVAQRLKTESVDEVLAFCKRLRAPIMNNANAQTLATNFHSKPIIDLAGPYTGRHTFAATLPSAILMAQSGVPVYTHSSPSLPPKWGVSLADMAQGLGLPTSETLQDLNQQLKETNMGFALTEHLCAPLAQIRHIREEIGVRTFLNTVEKLLNITQAHTLIVGVFHRTVIDLHVALVRALGYREAYIVQGVEGSEDLPLHRKSFYYKVTPEEVHALEIDPEDYGLKRKRDRSRETLNLEQQIEIIQRILKGDTSADIADFRAQVLFNTAVRYYFCGRFPTVSEALQFTEQQLKEPKGVYHEWDVFKSTLVSR